MSLRFFTVLALSLRKKEDLDLRPAHIHSYCGPRSCAFHVVAQDSALTLCVGRQRCGRLPCVRFTHSPLVYADWKTRQHGRLRCTGCESNASLSRPLQTDVSVERHLSRIFPCLTRPLARCLSRAPSPHRTKTVRRGPRFCGNCAALLCTACAPRGFGFQKIFSANLRTERGRKDFPNLPKKRRLALGAGHIHHPNTQRPRVRGPRYSRRFTQECPE